MAETHECGSSDPTLARPGCSGGETAGSRVVESSELDCAVLDDSDDDDEQQRESMAQVELRDESVRCGRWTSSCQVQRSVRMW